MDLVALTDQREIAKAIDQLKATLRDGSERRNLLIHTPAGESPCVVMWHARHQFWASISLEGGGTQYWCCYGVLDPTGSRPQRPVVEINPPVEGKNAHCQGVFARDTDGGVHYLHTGRLGGGAVGVGKAAFLASGFYDRERVVVRWPDDYSREMFDMGTLGDVQLTAALAGYVHAVAKFRLQQDTIDPWVKKRRPAAGAVRIFVSHSHEDNAWCRAFVERLRRLGADVWYDEHNLGHGSLNRAIEQQLADRPNFVVVLSPAAVASHWVRDEMDAAQGLAHEDPDHIILPVVADVCDIPLFYRSYKRICGPGDTPVSPEEAARRVAQELKVEPARPGSL